MWNRLNVLLVVITLAATSALSYSSVQAADVMMARAKNPCAANPCSMKNPCSMRVNPCSMGANPCSMGANPCSMGANPCSMKNPCASSGLIPLRHRAIKGKKQLKKMAVRLWNDTSLGTSGLSCNTCHPKGKGLKKKAYPRYIEMPKDIVTLDQMINYCVLNPMKGKALKWNSQKMTALAAYVTARAKGGKPAMNPCSMKGNPCSMKKNPCSRR